ncbi:MAG TPA: Kazal-type serine protease inhibitor domain-containing protein [Thermoanaerobaculia bacterium]|nr:Kazal-type serine protease inhibitor domain-containing protein [Thermoanaerobaculia bacterium]
MSELHPSALLRSMLPTAFAFASLLLFTACPPKPKPPVTCGGIAGIQCPAGQTCNLPAGQCKGADLMGSCVQVPEVCTQVVQPVCGCDGKTYSNDCERLKAGAQKDHDGECAPPAPQVCKDDAECGSGSFCEMPPGACFGAAGSCEAKPEICPQIFDPVCGCDGKTYGNDCTRKSAGVRLAHKGECGAVCGGLIGKPCPDGQVCEVHAETCGADLQGECLPRPDACTREFNPVCGCDRKTYPNDCERLKAGVQRASFGECQG